MVNAELIHNPYLLQTTVRFNGNPPHINSQIEKYERENLHLWAKKIPDIFRDEMNGYDFDLFFTGTVRDCEEIQQAFASAGVTSKDVRIFHKNELESVDQKCKEIDDLIQWLLKRTNRRFDAHAFLEENTDLFEHIYPCIIIGENMPADMESVVSPESVQSYEELEKTVLRYTPILFIVDEQSKAVFRENLTRILHRSDVSQNQLFFMIAPYLNEEQVRRVICDLGVEEPQILTSAEDHSILRYVRNYPMTEYVQRVIAILEKTTAEIGEVLKAANEQSALTNASVYEEMEGLDQTIAKLKEIDTLFCEGDNYQRPMGFGNAMERLKSQIGKWRNRRTKVTGDEEIEIAAKEYDAELRRCFETFKQELRTVFADQIGFIQHGLQRKYSSQSLETGYQPQGDTAAPTELPYESLVDTFVEMKQESFENPDNALFGRFWLDGPGENREPIRVVTCYYEHWRDKAAEILIPMAEKMAGEYTDRLRSYYVEQTKYYHKHMLQLIDDQTSKKNETAKHLSEDEKLLQEDNDWLRSFCDRLTHIERG